MHYLSRPILFFALSSLLLLSACQPEAAGSGSISPDVFLASPPANALVLDVRTEDEFSRGHLANALNVPHDELASRVAELGGGSDRPVVVYCERGGRAGKAATVLEAAGYSNILHLEGDMSDWRAKGRPLEGTTVR